jgi:hypothetical protein
MMIGDTNEAEQLLSDEEINACLKLKGSVILAAVQAARNIAAAFSREADKGSGKYRISYNQRAKAYNDLADKIKIDNPVLAVPYAGGLSHGEKDAAKQNTDAVQPIFKRDDMDYKGGHDLEDERRI